MERNEIVDKVKKYLILILMHTRPTTEQQFSWRYGEMYTKNK